MATDRHLTLLITTLYYSSTAKFAWNTTGALISYRLAFLSAAATYGIVIYKAYRARFCSGSMPSGQQGVIKILAGENVQYSASRARVDRVRGAELTNGGDGLHLAVQQACLPRAAAVCSA